MYELGQGWCSPAGDVTREGRAPSHGRRGRGNRDQVAMESSRDSKTGHGIVVGSRAHMEEKSVAK
eukprot:1333901-Amorphochlora_amoeboformis.AAC.1